MARPSSSLLHYIRMIAGANRADPRSDVELLWHYAETHDETAFSTLMDRHRAMVWGVCRHVLGDTQDAEDAYQVVFLTLAQKAGQIHDTLGGWLHRVACRTARHARTSLRSRLKLQDQFERVSGIDARCDSEQNEVNAILHDELAKLSETLRVPLVLHYLEGKTQVEVARILGVSEPTIWKRLTRGKAILQKRLSQQGLSVGAAAIGAMLAGATSQAALSPGLVAKTVKAATAIHDGKLTGGIAELAKQVLRRTPSGTPWWMKGWLIAVVCVGGLAGSGVAWKMAKPGAEAVSQHAAPNQAALRQEKKNSRPLRFDAYGDPLPEHALARMGTIRLKQQHCSFRPIVVFSPDGKILASQSGGWEKKIRVWEAGSGRKMLEFGDKDNTPDGWLTFSPDGRTLATTNSFYTVRIWDSASGKLLRTYEQPKSQKTGADVRTCDLLGMHFSPKGKILVVEDQEISSKDETRQWKLWQRHVRDVTTGEVVPLKGSLKNDIEAVAFSPNGKLLAGASHLDYRGQRSFGLGGKGDIEINLWETGTGKKVRQIKIKAERNEKIPEKDIGAYYDTVLRKLTFSPDGKTLAAFKCSTINAHNVASIYLWETATGKKINRLAGGEGVGFSKALAFSPDGTKLVGGAGHLWDAATGHRIRLFEWGETDQVAYSPTGKIIATLEETGQIRLWDVDAGREMGFGPRAGVATIAYASDGKTLVTETEGAENMLRWWDVGTGKEIGQRGTGDVWHVGAVFSSDGKMRLTKEARESGALLRPDEGLALSELDTGKEIGFFREKFDNRSFPVFSHDGKLLAMISEDGTIHVWNTGTKAQIYALTVDGKPLRSPFRVAFSPDDKLLAASGSSATVVFWDMTTGQVAGSLAEQELRAGWENRGRSGPLRPAESLSPLLFSPDGRALVTMTAWTAGMASCALRDVAGGRKIYQLPMPVFQTGSWPSFAFSPNGGLLAVAGTPGWDNAVHLMDVISGKEIGRLAGHQDKVNALVFSPDGNILASCSDDATCLIWDMTGFGPARDRFVSSNRPRPKQLSEKELETAWRDLGLDSAKAYRAIWDLSAAPAQAIPLLQTRIRPAAGAADPGRLERWIADLDSSRFTVRQKALRSIEEFGEAAAPHLRHALKGKLPIEVRRQLQDSLAKIKAPLRELRAVQVLESIGTPEAQKTLQGWAQGLGEAKLTQDAQAALARLAKRSAGKP